MVPSGQYVACGSAVGWPYGCRAGAARGLRPGKPTPLSRICDGVGGSRRHVRVPADGPPSSVRCTTWRPCAVREPRPRAWRPARQRPRRSRGPHGRGRAGPSLSSPVRRVPYGHCGTMKGGSARSWASKIWPSRGSLIRHAPRCSGNMGSGWGGGRLGSAPRPADCDERRARSGSGPCVEHDCFSLTLCNQ